ncbi:hypothetical protein GLAREA_03605 [Glarea lozoyensis ATCC 20868]|uniref:Uncharacterized protein n=1 Tax=Glarea lozoyensis (strain ATCC 20868 / MF5171) TaxID=1116229 RepID=S3DW70_GLAL2|nr:uncharacterized protein GLAREA_03605 [Glarea lozoyensis ATCC 20868]EPE30638.1 hypothetical protein GLAREA_03605 [Glarea lozoyensis ATCC 20868]
MTSGAPPKMEKVVEEPNSPTPFPPFNQPTSALSPPLQPDFTGNLVKENRTRTIYIQTKDLDPAGEVTALRKSITITQDPNQCGDNDASDSPFLTPITPSESGRLLQFATAHYKSLSSAELSAQAMGADEFVKVAERLKTEEPPMTLEQVRQRRASIKEDRKKSIEFIRSRTNSRAAAMGHPNIDGEVFRSRANSRATVSGRPPLGERNDSYRSDRND